MRAPHSDLPTIAADILERIRARRPRVHCITNAVAQTLTANMLLSAGAVPSMTIAAREVRAFAARADALLVNLGTFDPERQKAALTAIPAVQKTGRPWVLDPVFIDRSPPRAAFARKLLAKRPQAVRLNRAEFETLSGGTFDAAALARFAKSRRTAIGLTGARDFVRDATRTAAIDNGHPLMTKVTAMGCAGSAMVAACLAVEPDAFRATASALIVMGVAGELAAKRARGPGSFAVEILDAVHGLNRRTLLAKAKVS
ncbi:MAG: hydroxyethylthiazole kinase [Alphaproteobacteria bacterium]|nr:hydroxyethylthiazole kinase [Alphaproteobacteria bacterium]